MRHNISHHLRQESTWIIILLLLIGGLFYSRSACHVVIGDELRYFYTFDLQPGENYFNCNKMRSIHGFGDIVDSQVNHYQTVNGRTLVHTIIHHRRQVVLCAQHIHISGHPAAFHTCGLPPQQRKQPVGMAGRCGSIPVHVPIARSVMALYKPVAKLSMASSSHSWGNDTMAEGINGSMEAHKALAVIADNTAVLLSGMVE